MTPEECLNKIWNYNKRFNLYENEITLKFEDFHKYIRVLRTFGVYCFSDFESFIWRAREIRIMLINNQYELRSNIVPMYNDRYAYVIFEITNPDKFWKKYFEITISSVEKYIERQTNIEKYSKYFSNIGYEEEATEYYKQFLSKKDDD